jgi:hypothetical protein
MSVRRRIMSKGRHDRSSSRLSLGEMIFDNSQAIPLKIPPGSQMSVTGMFRQLTRGPTKGVYAPSTRVA